MKHFALFRGSFLSRTFSAKHLLESRMATVRWGIIGCGDVTEVKSGPALQKARNSALVAVMRRDAAKAEDYARRHQVPRWYADADALIRDPEVDAVYIATPPASHMEYVLRVAAARKPVYVEKPMGRNHNECQRMIGACNSAGVPLFVAYYRRALPRFLKVKELLENGAIGEVRFVSVRLYQPPFEKDYDRENLPWRVQPEIAGAGYFMDLASHTLDLLDYFLGRIATVQGLAENQAGLYPAEDVVAAVWRHEGGAVGEGIWSFASAEKEDMVEIVGSEGTIRFATFAQKPVRWYHDGRSEAYEIPHPPHIQQPLIQSIVDELNGEGRCPSTGVTGARTNWVMDQILAEYRRRKGFDRLFV